MKPLCIYHGNCADGCTAAWAVWKRFGEDCEYVAANYGDAPPDVDNRDVIIVDFSYKRAVLLEMAEAARSVFLLDHHKTAAEDLKGFLGPMGYNPDVLAQQYDEQRIPPISVLFDMERSGAGMAWDFFHPDTQRPAFVSHVEDRDLWRFAMPWTREVHAAMSAYPFSFSAWEEIASTPLRELVEQGAAIDRKHKRDIETLVPIHKRYMVIGGHRVPVANLPMTMTSDAGNLMCTQPMDGVGDADWCAEKPLFAACYWDTPKGRVFSLRSVGDFDVSAIAAKYGGGGHKNAAGFTLPHGAAP